VSLGDGCWYGRRILRQFAAARSGLEASPRKIGFRLSADYRDRQRSPHGVEIPDRALRVRDDAVFRPPTTNPATFLSPPGHGREILAADNAVTRWTAHFLSAI